jgi:hypothetical protein
VNELSPQVTETPTPETPAQPQSVRDTILAAVKEVEAKAPSEGRDDKGRFAPKEQGKQAAPSAAPTETTNPEGVDVADAQPKKLDAPATWRNEAKAKWDALDPLLKDEILKREKESAQAATARGEEIKQVKAFYDEIGPVISPRLSAWQQQGLTPKQAVSELFQISDYAGRDPAGFIKWFQQRMNLNPQDGAQSQLSVDPDISRLEQTIQGLQSKLQQFEGYTQQQQLASTKSEIESFATEKDASGNPVRPHFDAVEAQIRRLIPIIKAENPGAQARAILQKAYDEAVYLNPETREQIIQSRLGQTQKDREAAEVTERAKKAQQAGKLLSGGTPMGTRPVGSADPTNLRATLVAAMQQHGYQEARL